MSVGFELNIKTTLPEEELRAVIGQAFQQARRLDTVGPFDPEVYQWKDAPNLVFAGTRFFVYLKAQSSDGTRHVEGACGLAANWRSTFVSVSSSQLSIALDEIAQACRLIFSRPEIYGILGFESGRMLVMKDHAGTFRQQGMSEEFLPWFEDYTPVAEVPCV